MLLLRGLFTDEPIECIRRFAWHGRDVLAMLLTGFGKSTIYLSIPKVLFHMECRANATSKIHRCYRKSVGLHPKSTSDFHWKNGSWNLFRNQFRETAMSRMESLTLCLEVQFGFLHQTKHDKGLVSWKYWKTRAILTEIIAVMVFFVMRFKHNFICSEIWSFSND